MKKIRLYILLAQTLISFVVFAQEPYFTVIDKSKGLPFNSVYCITQDKKGFIWVPHNEGISRFDGYIFMQKMIAFGLSK